MENLCMRTVEALRQRGFEAVYCATAEDASSAVMAEVDAAQRVGMGGSVTMKELGVTERLNASGKLQTRGADCDLFLLSANAITEDGRIVNIDGNGNRVAALIYGPANVVVIVGTNKIVKDEAAAMDRVKNLASPTNSKRLNMPVPCVKTGKCEHCVGEGTICCHTVISRVSRQPGRIKVYIVNEALGF